MNVGPSRPGASGTPSLWTRCWGNQRGVALAGGLRIPCARYWACAQEALPPGLARPRPVAARCRDQRWRPLRVAQRARSLSKLKHRLHRCASRPPCARRVGRSRDCPWRCCSQTASAPHAAPARPRSEPTHSSGGQCACRSGFTICPFHPAAAPPRRPFHLVVWAMPGCRPHDCPAAGPNAVSGYAPLATPRPPASRRSGAHRGPHILRSAPSGRPQLTGPAETPEGENVPQREGTPINLRETVGAVALLASRQGAGLPGGQPVCGP